MSPASVHARRWQRYYIALPVQVIFRRHGVNTTIVGRGTNLSRGGMTLHAAVPLEPQDHIEIDFQTPSKLHIRGIIRNRAGHRFGVEFLNPIQS